MIHQNGRFLAIAFDSTFDNMLLFKNLGHAILEIPNARNEDQVEAWYALYSLTSSALSQHAILTSA